nr:thioredoxin family protein [Desulfovibrio litoralis]
MRLQCMIMSVFFSLFVFSGLAYAESELLPVPNTVTMIDLGADACIPCKMMAPILVKLRSEYEGKAAIVFIDVWKNPTEANKFGIKLIPTQIFYDKTGKEITRHEGFMSEEDIKKQLDTLLN